VRVPETEVEAKGKRFLLRVEDSHQHKDYLKYEELRNEIWGWPEDRLPGGRNMMCENLFLDGSSLFIGAFAESGEGAFQRLDGAHLVGFAYGFVGVKDKEIGFRSVGNLQFYSQYTGVRPGFERYGLGVAIKEIQKRAVTDLLGIETVTCTYDPLTSVNAHRNIHHFGMQVVGYNVDIYGEFGGRLNRIDVPSDRFAMSWDLGGVRRKPSHDFETLIESRRVVNTVRVTTLRGKSGPVELEILERVELGLDHEILLVEIPFDFYQMLAETDVEDESVRRLPIEWRMKTRRIFQELFDRNYGVIDFRQAEIDGRKRGLYVLSRV